MQTLNCDVMSMLAYVRFTLYKQINELVTKSFAVLRQCPQWLMFQEMLEQKGREMHDDCESSAQKFGKSSFDKFMWASLVTHILAGLKSRQGSRLLPQTKTGKNINCNFISAF